MSHSSLPDSNFTKEPLIKILRKINIHSLHKFQKGVANLQLVGPNQRDKIDRYFKVLTLIEHLLIEDRHLLYVMIKTALLSTNMTKISMDKILRKLH